MPPLGDADGPSRRLAIDVDAEPGRFSLTLGSGGTAVRDAGNVTWSTRVDRTVTRDGRRVRIWAGDGSFVGRRGALTLRFRWEWFDAGRGHEAGVGTWSVVTGSDVYAGLRGTGRSAAVWLPRGPVASRMDGRVHQG